MRLQYESGENYSKLSCRGGEISSTAKLYRFTLRGVAVRYWTNNEIRKEYIHSLFFLATRKKTQSLRFQN